MPQLAIETFVSQYFWLVTILFTFYYIATTEIIPKFSVTFKTRRKIEILGSNTDNLLDNSNSENSSHLVTEVIKGIVVTEPGQKINTTEIFSSSNSTWIKNNS